MIHIPDIKHTMACLLGSIPRISDIGFNPVSCYNLKMAVIQDTTTSEELYYHIYASIVAIKDDGIILIKDNDSHVYPVLYTLAKVAPSITITRLSCCEGDLIVLHGFPYKQSLPGPETANKLIKAVHDTGIDKLKESIQTSYINSGPLHSRLITNTVDYPVDIVYTLADAPNPIDNENLRLSLRSVDSNAVNLRNVIVVTANPPSWLTNVEIIPTPDTFTHNKDANLITKIMSACNSIDVSDRFIFMSDDNIIHNTVDLSALIPTFNNRSIKTFTANPNPGKWARRMINTMTWIDSIGGSVNHNWDSHAPQPIDKHMFARLMPLSPYLSEQGVCINTAYFGAKFEPYRVDQRSLKDTYEQSTTSFIPPTHDFVGYNDSGYSSGLREYLMDKFKTKSKYEKD